MHLACSNGSTRVFKALLEYHKLKLDHLCSSAYKFLPLHSLCRVSNDDALMAAVMVEHLLKKIIELKLIVEFHAAKTKNKTNPATTTTATSSSNWRHLDHQLQNLTLNHLFIKSLLPQVVERLSAYHLLMAYTGNGSKSTQGQTLARNENRLGWVIRKKLFFVSLFSLLILKHSLLFSSLSSFNDPEILRKFELTHLVDETASFLVAIVNRRDEMEQSALVLAIQQNNKFLVETLFKYGALSTPPPPPMRQAANLNNRLRRQRNSNMADVAQLPAHAAAKLGNVEMFSLLASHNAISLKADSFRMNNLFHIAAYYNRCSFLAKVKLVLDDLRRSKLLSPFPLFKTNFNNILLKALDYYKRKKTSSLGGESNELKWSLEASNSFHMTPLFVAVSRNYVECVRVFIDEWPSSSLYVSDTWCHYNLFHVCSLHNSCDVLLYMLEVIKQQQQQQQQKEADKEKATTETYYECTNTNDDNDIEDKEELNNSGKNVSLTWTFRS